MLSVAIMADPRRAAFVGELQRTIPEALVVWDRGRGRWDTGRRALLAHDEGATHRLVLQDDSLPCRNLIPAAARIAERAGRRPVSLYTGRFRPAGKQRPIAEAFARAERAGAPYFSMEGPWHGVALLLPTAHIPELVEWADARTDIPSYDRRISRWHGAKGIACWYTLPSLVDHRPEAENPSLIHDSGRRPSAGDHRAHRFIGDADPLDIDWSREPA